ncbi:hypothetical protein RB195_019214 [Necator americanus]|uniref:AGC-kinase C-terminal domain-containing protein n=1 Tax=Necator americanus TaxID=51031 RepID=A0ABR1CFR3_NECAM
MHQNVLARRIYTDPSLCPISKAIRFSDPYDWEMRSDVHTEPGSLSPVASRAASSLLHANEYNPFPEEFFSMDPLGF